MAATINLKIGGGDIQYSFEVEDSNGDISITKIVSALKMMRQVADKTLTKYVEEEKHRGGKERGVVESNENMEDSDYSNDDENMEDSDDSNDDEKDYDDGRKEHSSPHSKKQKTEL